MKKWKLKLGKFVVCIVLASLLPTVASAQNYYPSNPSRGCCPPAPRSCCPAPCCPPQCNYAPQPCCPPQCNYAPQPYGYTQAPSYNNYAPNYGTNFDCCDQGGDNNEPGFSIGADFIWVKPVFNGLDYAYTVTGLVNGTDTGSSVQYKGICPKWEPGVNGRLVIPVACSSLSLRGYYTWFQSSETKTTTAGTLIGDSVFNPLFEPNLQFSYDQVSAEWRSIYNNFDAVFAFTCNCCETNKITPYFGVGGLFLTQDLNTKMTNPLVTVSDTAATRWHDYLWGVGLTVGSEFEYGFCNGFALYGSAKGSMLAGQDCVKNKQIFKSDLTTAGHEDVIRDDGDCRLIPGCQLAAGVKFSPARTCGLNLGFRVGYEFVRWFNVANPRVWSGTDSFTSGNANLGTFGFHGLFAGLDIGF